MSKRPVQHIIGDQGIAEVLRALAAAGWACDHNRSDYGEDLTCQTELRGEVDSYRILIQVKAIAKALNRDELSVRIQAQTVQKWISGPSLVVLCLWAKADQKLLYAIPEDQVDPSALARSDLRTVAIRVEQKNQLDPAAISNIAWKARLHNLSRRFAELEARGRYLNDVFFGRTLKDDQRSAEMAKCNQGMSDIAGQFLVYIDLFQRTDKGLSANHVSFAEDMVLLGAGPIKELGLDVNGLTSLQELLSITLWERTHRVLSYRGTIPRNILSGALRLYAHHLLHELAYAAKTSDEGESKLLEIAHHLCLVGASYSPSEVENFINFLKQDTPEGKLKIIKMEISQPSDRSDSDELL